MNLEKTGHIIAELRKQNNFTQEELGKKLGVSNKTISRYETGAYMIPTDILINLCKIFNVNVNEILTGKELSNKYNNKNEEEKLINILENNEFCLKDKIHYYKKKYIKDHISLIVLYLFLLILVLVFGIINEKAIYLLIVEPICFIVLYLIFNNSMMAYVEKNVYDGKGYH